MRQITTYQPDGFAALLAALKKDMLENIQTANSSQTMIAHLAKRKNNLAISGSLFFLFPKIKRKNELPL